VHLNVLHLIDSFEQGGTERQAVQLARLLTDAGRFRVHIACLKPTGALRAEVEDFYQDSIESFPLTSFYDRNMLRQTARFVRYLREREIHILHTHDFYTNIFGHIAGARARTPVRIASRRETEGIRTPTQKRVERSVYRIAHAVIANAEAVRRQLIGEGVNEAKIKVVYNGLDAERLTPRNGFSREQTLAEFNLPTSETLRFVTIVANMRLPVKDQKTFLYAARRVREYHPNARFVLAGEGELLETYRAFAAQLNLETEAFFIGRCADVAEVLSVSDVCVLSSKAEGFSNSILEYMAAARPVVATDVGGAREQIVEGETGYLVVAGDAEAMADRIINLLEDTGKARAMGERGRERVLSRFSCDAQLERTHTVYDELLTARRVARKMSREIVSSGEKEARIEPGVKTDAF
jgi:glycosyltransferase involved in cell wall biosynthesis